MPVKRMSSSQHCDFTLVPCQGCHQSMIWQHMLCVSRPLVLVQVDASYNTQPENMESVWNLRGVINNAWHHVNVEAK